MRPRWIRLVLTVLFCPLLTGSLAADIYWVSPNGAATWDRARSSIPLNGPACTTLLIANQNATAGDTVYIRGGEYRGTTFLYPQHSGLSWSKPITFSAYGNENVIATSQICPNRDHEKSAWTSLNGARVEHCMDPIWQGQFSSRFSTRDAGQGIISKTFPLSTGFPYVPYFFSAWVHSTRDLVHVTIRNGDDSGESFSQDISLIPGEWCYISEFFPAGTSGDQATISFSSPAGCDIGTWTVDNVRIHPYLASLYLDNTCFIKIEGITFRAGARGMEIRNGSCNNEISHCEFTDMDAGVFYSTNIIWNANALASTRNWIHHSSFHDNGFVDQHCDDRGCALRLGNNGVDESGHNLIEDCSFYHNAHDNSIISTRHNTIRNNWYQNEGWMSNHHCSGCQDSDGNPDTFNNPKNGYGNRNLLFEESDADHSGFNLIEGNRMGFSGTPPDDDGSNGIENPTDGNIVRYNQFYANGMSGYYFKPQPEGRPDDNRIYNNTICFNGRGEDISLDYQAGILYGDGTSSMRSKGNILLNNIVFANNVAPLRGGDSDFLFSVNRYINNFEDDPHFVNPDLSDPSRRDIPDLRLQASSPAIDAGSPLTTVSPEDTGHGTTLHVHDARFFQDGSWGPQGKISADWLAIGLRNQTVQITSIDYSSQTIQLAQPVSRSGGDSVWLYKNSSNAIVLRGSAPDIGAEEFIDASPVLTVVSPNGQETWRKGETHTISWNHSEVSGTWTIELIQDNQTVGTIAQGLDASQGSYLWKVGNLLSGSMRTGTGFTVRIRLMR